MKSLPKFALLTVLLTSCLFAQPTPDNKATPPTKSKSQLSCVVAPHIMRTFLLQHMTVKSITPEIQQRTVKSFLESIDGMKLYLTKAEYKTLDEKLTNMFKTMITQKTIHINQKYIPSYTIPDTINYYFTSNDPDAFYLADSDRRFFIHEVLCDRLPDALRKTFVKWRDSAEGVEHLFYYMQNLDLGDFDPQAAAPTTAAKRDMMHISKSELGVWVHRLKHEPASILNGKMRGDLFTAEELYMLYDPLGDKRASPNALARELKRSGLSKLQQSTTTGIRVGDRNLRLYVVRNVDEWRHAKRQDIIAHYTDTHGTKEKF